jgi:hypothetical protein
MTNEHMKRCSSLVIREAHIKIPMRRYFTCTSIVWLWWKRHTELGLAAHTCKPSTQETEAGGSLAWGQLGL